MISRSERITQDLDAGHGLDREATFTSAAATKIALGVIAVLSFVGACFSGYFAWLELLAIVPPSAACRIPGQPGLVLGYPACVWGFCLFVLVFAVTALGLTRAAAASPSAASALGSRRFV